MSDEISKIAEEKATIYYLLFPDDFAIIRGEKDVHSIKAYQEPGPLGPTTWFRTRGLHNNTLMLINSIYVQIVGYQPLTDEKYY